jgi:hypothetical protein
MTMRVAVAVLLVSLAARAPRAAAEPPRLRLELEAGSEVDSNVHRTAAPDGDAIPAVEAVGARAGARATLSWRPRPRASLRLHALAVGKLFAAPAEASEENVAVVSADARFDAALPGRPVAVALRGSYYDAMERGEASRDFRTADASFGFTLLGGDDDRVTTMGGYRVFQYKPNPTLDFAGEQGAFAYRHSFRREDDDAGDSSLDLSVGYGVQRRRYDGDAYTNVCPDAEALAAGCLLPSGRPRADLFHAAFVDVSWLGERILGARYELQVNDSNSFGQSLVRHRVELSATTETWADVFLTAKLVALASYALDPVLLSGDVGTFLTIEDESHNSLVLHVTRDLGRAVTFEARYAYYTDEFAPSAVTFQRHTLYLGLLYAWSSGSAR